MAVQDMPVGLVSCYVCGADQSLPLMTLCAFCAPDEVVAGYMPGGGYDRR